MTNIHYLDPGDKDGRPVVLLHGLGVEGSSWVLQFPALKNAGFRPIAVDIPGFGNSPYGKKRWNIERVSRDLAGFIRENELFPVCLVGLSMGGTIAQQITLDFPDLVKKLVLANTFSFLRPASIAGWLYFFQRFFIVHTLGLEVQANFVAKRVFPLPEQQVLRNEMVTQIRKADPRAYRAAMRSLGFFNSKDRLKTINIPTLVITGTKDTTVHPTHQSTMAKLIPAARQVFIEDAGHAVSVEFPDVFNRVILEFLSE